MKDKENKNKQEGLSEQVHSEFETSVGNNYDAVREEAHVDNKKDIDKDKNRVGPLNQLSQDQASVKNDQEQTEEPPKMDAGEKKTEG